ncbi:bifunctional uridylate/adenylate kinase [Lunasporangiospora selenospora]|uniref:Uridylate kinase n=1 Tax=Lunasporangiospora selenospora TaxID=979761 RepID=A0A9P6FV34_9FUNG|nr:bifunctional uridylate/adenylate kinase [Lunasporangiospora selenospora]
MTSASGMTGRRLFSASTIQRAAGNASQPPKGGKGGSNWLTITALTALAATSGYYLFSPVDAKPITKKANAAVPAAKTPAPAAPAASAQTNIGAVLIADPVKKAKLQDTTVIFVLGGPGAGKGTQCANLVRDFGFIHLSAGDLLRAEQERPGSQFGELIKTYIKEGKIVPMEVTIALLENAMLASGQKRFLIDGFPRKMDQALKFEEVVVPSKCTLYFECPEEVMLGRLMKRGETSGRADDNIESIRKRFRVFTKTSFPVIEHFGKEGRVHTVSCEDAPDVVYARVKKIFNDLFHENK